MSSALVQKALEIVDSDFKKGEKSNKQKKSTNVCSFIPESQKLTKIITRKGRKEKISVLETSRKLTVLEARKQIKSKDEIIKNNLAKLKKVKEACTINLDKELTEKIIERAVTRRPIKTKKKPKKEQKTAFTEEDFKNFEEEYLAS